LTGFQYVGLHMIVLFPPQPSQINIFVTSSVQENTYYVLDGMLKLTQSFVE